MTQHVSGLVAGTHGDRPDVMAAITQVVAGHCAKDAWSADVRTCIVNSAELEAGHHCLDQLPAAQHETLMADLDATTHPKPPATDDDGLPESCHRYREMMEVYFMCDKIPQASRDAAKAGFDTAWESWKGMPAEARAALADACKSAADAAQVMVCPK